MLGLLSRNGVCPCCAYAMTPSPRRASAFTCTAPSAFAGGSRFKAGAWTSSGATLLIEGGTIVDPRDGGLLENATVLIGGDRIIGVEEGAATKSDPAVQRIDARGKFVVPGYNDMHSHVLELENPSGALALMLAEGVTGFRQMSGSPERLAQRRSGTLPIGEAAPGVLEIPGTILTPLNADTTEAVIAEIRRQKQQGADFIKAGMISAPVFLAALEEARSSGIPILGHLQDGVDAVVAAQAGFRSVEHLGPGITVWIACSTAEDELKSEIRPLRIKAPPRSVPLLHRLIMSRLQTMLINPAAFVKPEYTQRLQRAIDTFSDEKFETLAARFVAEETWHVPTLVRLRTQELADAPEYRNAAYLRYMPEKSVKKWRQVTDKFSKLSAAMRKTFADTYPRQLRLTKALADGGVRMMTGTDGGWLAGPGLTLKEEFAELGKAGLTPLKILQMATINAAEYLDRADTMGAVEPGRNADLVILDADPLASVENLQAISGVVRAGRYFPRSDLDALRARVAVKRGFLN